MPAQIPRELRFSSQSFGMFIEIIATTPESSRQTSLLTRITLVFKKYFPHKHVQSVKTVRGFASPPNVEVTVIKTPALESQTIPQKICQTTRKCHSGIGFE